MGDALLWILLLLALLQGGLLVILLLRKSATTIPEERLSRLESTIRDESERARREQSASATELRTELTRSVKDLGDVLGARIKDSADAQAKANEAFASTLARSLSENADKVEKLRVIVETKLDGFHSLATTHREQLSGAFDTFRQETTARLSAFGEQQITRFTAADLKDAEQAANLRKEMVELNEKLSAVLVQRVAQLNTDMTAAWKTFGEEITKLQTSVTVSLTEIRADNEKRLEEMRKTVDEKLHNTLEQRLGESFKLVSERLESVQKGLGEMQSLASGVGDLKRVLTNVKTRGTWGEVLLNNLLEQILTPEQYESNVATTGTAERVEFAIKLPGRGDSGQVWLPIDSKFPKEDYERLLAAQDAADPEAALDAGKALERSIKKFAQDIADKYVESPKTTDFGIMFLPSESLYAEVIRRTETMQHLQQKCRVLVTGPSTLAALLNSLQMGFRTLAIEKRSSQVWELLGAVKTEFSKYGEIMAKVKKKLEEAGRTIDDTEKRTRAINRKLRDVESIAQEKATTIFPTIPLLEEPTDTDE